MNRIPLPAVPNQTLEVLLDGNRYRLTLKEAGNVMAMTVTRDDTVVITGHRPVLNEPIIPARYQEAGNFVFVSDGEDIPYYTNFGSSQRLLYLPQNELEALRNV